MGKGEDLNHYGTLYAGRTAEWFVESGFIAAASMTKLEKLVCLKKHGMTFSRPIHKVELPVFSSHIVLTGETKIVSLIEVRVTGKLAVRGFITFIHVDLGVNLCRMAWIFSRLRLKILHLMKKPWDWNNNQNPPKYTYLFFKLINDKDN